LLETEDLIRRDCDPALFAAETLVRHGWKQKT